MGCRSRSVWGLLSVGHLTELYTYARVTFLCACQTSMQTSSCSFFNTETLIGSGKIKFKGLYRKIQMLVLKKDFLLCRGCGHVTPFMKNAPPLGVCVCGVVGSRPQSPTGRQPASVGGGRGKLFAIPECLHHSDREQLVPPRGPRSSFLLVYVSLGFLVQSRQILT